MRDPKSALQERVQADGFSAPWYRVVATRGPQHDQTFAVEVLVGDDVRGLGEGRSKRLAERAAAVNALDAIENPNRVTSRDGSPEDVTSRAEAPEPEPE